MRRRAYLEACGIGLVVGLAGCQNPETAVDGEIIETVDGLTITNHSAGEDDGFFEVAMDVENTGEQMADLDNYDFTVVPYNEDDNDVTGEGGETEHDDTMLPAGETTEVEVKVGTTGSPSDVERYEIRVTCSESAESPVYCDG